jgi:chromosome segregation ATPase
MVMSFFRRGEDKIGVRASYDGRETVSAAANHSASEALAAQQTVRDIRDYEALGTAIEQHTQHSSDLLSGVASLQSGISTLIDDHGRAMHEVGHLRADCARLEAQLQQETATRIRLDEQATRLSAENREIASELSQLRIEADTFRQEFSKLQVLHQVTAEERSIIETRLFDAENELRAQIKQYDEAAQLMTRAQQELDARSRELAAIREKLDTETTAHQMLAETSQREQALQARELARITDERNQLKNGLAEHEALARSLQINVGNSRQEITALEERYRRLETEFENLQSSSAMERAQMGSRLEAMNSKVMLAEKLLATANGRNRVTDDELHEAKSELKRLKTDHATLTARSERTIEELSRIRAIGAESESTRRELAAQCNELTSRFRQSEEMRIKSERETDMLKRDLDARADSDRLEIGQLRTSLEIARTEARQLKTEYAILTGQLEAARGERSRFGASHVATEEPWPSRPASAQPIIDISESALRLRTGGGAPGEFALDALDPSRLPPAE